MKTEEIIKKQDEIIQYLFIEYGDRFMDDKRFKNLQSELSSLKSMRDVKGEKGDVIDKFIKKHAITKQTLIDVYLEFLKQAIESVQSTESSPQPQPGRGAEDEMIKSAWDLKSVLNKLIEAADILLHRKDYDGHGWEEIETCYKRGKEIIQSMQPSYMRPSGEMEKLRTFINWANRKYQLFYDCFIQLKGNGEFEDPYKTSQPFLTFEEVYKIYEGSEEYRTQSEGKDMYPKEEEFHVWVIPAIQQIFVTDRDHLPSDASEHITFDTWEGAFKLGQFLSKFCHYQLELDNEAGRFAESES